MGQKYITSKMGGMSIVTKAISIVTWLQMVGFSLYNIMSLFKRLQLAKKSPFLHFIFVFFEFHRIHKKTSQVFKTCEVYSIIFSQKLNRWQVIFI